MPADLTKRERQVLELVALGLTNRAIARQLGLRPATVKGYLESVYHKLGVENRAAAAVLWVRGEPGPASNEAAP